jgi:hypothetical protein
LLHTNPGKGQQTLRNEPQNELKIRQNGQRTFVMNFENKRKVVDVTNFENQPKMGNEPLVTNFEIWFSHANELGSFRYLHPRPSNHQLPTHTPYRHENLPTSKCAELHAAATPQPTSKPPARQSRSVQPHQRQDRDRYSTDTSRCTTYTLTDNAATDNTASDPWLDCLNLEKRINQNNASTPTEVPTAGRFLPYGSDI